MKKSLTHIAALILGGGLMFGGTALAQSAEVTDAQTDKHEIAKAYLYAQARLNEVPTIDLSYISTEEASAAYAEIAAEKGALDPKQPNLFIALHDKAVEEGKSCQ